MTGPSDRERVRFEQDLQITTLIAEATAIEEASTPWKGIESDIFELLTAAAAGSSLHNTSIGARLRLRRLLGPRLELAILRFKREFQINQRPEHLENEAKKLLDYQEAELSAFFLKRVTEINAEQTLKRDEALKLAAEETQALAAQIYGTTPRHWRVVGLRSLQERHAKLLGQWRRNGYPRPILAADGRPALDKYGLDDLAGKKGGPGKKRGHRAKL